MLGKKKPQKTVTFVPTTFALLEPLVLLPLDNLKCQKTVTFVPTTFALLEPLVLLPLDNRDGPVARGSYEPLEMGTTTLY